MDRLTLATVIDARHLSAQAISQIGARLESSANRHVVIDNFLLAPHLDSLRQLVEQQGAFRPNLKVNLKGDSVAHLSEAQRRSRVDSALFDSVPEGDRFIAQEIYAGEHDSAGEARGAKIDRLIRQVFRTPAMHAWLSAISGMALERTLPINLKRHGKGHFLHRHSDASGGRKLCGVIYLHEDWQPAYRGRFVFYRPDGSVLAVDPLPNRLVLFDVTVGNDHAIEELGEVPDNWWRSNYSIWFQ